MKAQHNYTTPLTMATWLRSGTVALLALASLIVGLVLILSTNGHSSLPISASALVARHTSNALASCRSCRDEWVAAQAVQPAVAVSAQRHQPAGALAMSRATGLIEACRVCRDEWVAAQAPSSPTGGMTF